MSSEFIMKHNISKCGVSGALFLLVILQRLDKHTNCFMEHVQNVRYTHDMYQFRMADWKTCIVFMYGAAFVTSNCMLLILTPSGHRVCTS
jgi:hypothetical protein